MDLFDVVNNENKEKRGPLANRMRPKSLDEFYGQKHIVGKGTLLRRAIEADQLTPMIFFGPPGTGKTTLAKIIARSTDAIYEQLNAVTAGMSDIRGIMERAKERAKFEEKRTILFIDEIHRFNKAQQDALLPFVEDGTVVLIGATTESPMFEINRALLSRSRLFQFQHLDDNDIEEVLQRALTDKVRGFGKQSISIENEAMKHLVNISNGDARTALNALELAVISTEKDENNVINITLAIAEESIQKRVINYDKNGDNHYDTVSAFIKSIRGSDPDAALYYLAKMLYAGEDPTFICRRLMVHAAEDVGMADPNALLIAQAATHAVTFIGMPEARIPLAEATVYIATAPKSNAVYEGINKAFKIVENERMGEIPLHLRDTHYKGAKELNNGKGYKYPHDYENGFVKQQYLPDHLQHKSFYTPTERGFEKNIKKRLQFFKNEPNENK
ncbi:replication-associated recombination protein RarA [Lottiidibacillus patelloidae]|uniref:Replication-associated recombination protein A n=1 Tax=Lottiidibacillus patelloidae TaxID=2670334 RepID=A0A263BVU3_9BACI|nr:AAA family ATPase [Lottiidibacillus patelloidae]OZM57815.1 replication-associated recombination protein RarA [Lottiidibacillus patelloidae]